MPNDETNSPFQASVTGPFHPRSERSNAIVAIFFRVTTHERTLWTPLRHRDFRYLVTGHAISEIGDWLYNVALIVFVYERTGSGAWVAAAGIVRLVPYTLFGTIGGMIADRWSRKRVMIASDVIRAAVMVALAIVAATDGSALVAIGLTGLATTFAVAFSPCVSAAMPILVGEDDLAPANTLVTTVTNVSYAVGPALGGVLLVLGAPPIAFAVNGVTFLASAVVTLMIRADLGPERRPGVDNEISTPFRERFTEGFEAIRTSGNAVLLVMIWASSMLLYGQESVLYALVASNLLRTGTDGVAFLYAAIGVGGIAAAGLAHKASDSPNQGKALVIAAFAVGAPMFLLAFVRVPSVAYALLLGEGAAMIVLDVLIVTSLQRLLGNEVLGRAFGAIDSLIVASMLLGMLIAPVMVRFTSVSGALMIGGSLSFAAAAAILPRARSIDRLGAARAEALGPRVALLERLGIFDGASRVTLEGLAEVAVDVHVEGGVVVLHQGAHPDDLFVVVTGELDARIADAAGERVVGSIGEGEYFGEIGLLRGIPRTATVTALTACDLLRIPGDRFLAIVTGEASSAGALSRTVQARMSEHRASVGNATVDPDDVDRTA
jgi:predicted MFS family arabinose efflux permease